MVNSKTINTIINNRTTTMVTNSKITIQAIKEAIRITTNTVVTISISNNSLLLPSNINQITAMDAHHNLNNSSTMVVINIMEVRTSNKAIITGSKITKVTTIITSRIICNTKTISRINKTRTLVVTKILWLTTISSNTPITSPSCKTVLKISLSNPHHHLELLKLLQFGLKSKKMLLNSSYLQKTM